MTSTKAHRAHSTASNGNGKTAPKGEQFYQKMADDAAKAKTETKVGPEEPTVIIDPVDVETEETATPNRKERRRAAREALAAEKEARWAECLDAAREGMSLARDLKEEAQRQYDKATAEYNRVEGNLADVNGFGAGFWKVFNFLTGTAGFNDHEGQEERDLRVRQLEAEMVQVSADHDLAAHNLKVANRQYRIAKTMTARYRMRHYNAKNHGYNRAAAWTDIKHMGWAPLRFLGYAIAGLILTAATVVTTVVAALGVVATGALALVAKVVGTVRGLASWVGSLIAKDPVTA